MLRLILILLVLLAVLANPNAVAQKATGSNAVPGEWLIKFRTEILSAQRRTVLARRGAEVIRHYPTLGIDHIRLTSSRGVKDDAKALAAEEDILYAQPNYIRHTNADPPPNDPYWLSGDLWNMSAIHADLAWLNFTTGSGNVVVMDIDTGANYNHEDLAANIWNNPGEIPGNGVDDDGNGYVDDIHGINTAGHTSDPIDDAASNHGTHTAGTMAAVGNNGLGVVGVSWNAKVVPCKAFNSAGDGEDSAIIECFDYAVALKRSGINIRATNNSYGGTLGPGEPFPDALKAAFDSAAAAGIVNVCAAGNDRGVNNDTTPYYPASFDSPGLIAVAASGGANDNITYFTNYGPTSVDLAAPGEGILSTQSNSYGFLSGTSMSTPHVTGAVALLADLQPELSVETAKSLILNNVDVLPQWTGLVVSNGRLNVFTALQSAAFGKQSFSLVNLTRSSASSFQFSWSCAPGLRYRVYSTNNLTSGFTALGPVLTAAQAQTVMNFTDASATAAPKFYRVITVP